MAGPSVEATLELWVSSLRDVKAQAVGDPSPWRQQAIPGRGRWDAGALCCTEPPEAMADWSLTSLQLKLIKMRARIVRHARAIAFQRADVAVSGDLFRRILTAIHGLRAPPAET